MVSEIQVNIGSDNSQSPDEAITGTDIDLSPMWVSCIHLMTEMYQLISQKCTWNLHMERYILIS